MGTNTIDIEALRKVTNRIFDFIERDLQVQSVELFKNYYWNISDDLLYDMDQQPRELDVGSLVDDLDFVMAAQRDPSQAIPLTLMHIAPLLQLLSRSVPSHKSPPSNT